VRCTYNLMSTQLKDLQFQLVGGQLCLDFANTLDNRGSDNEVNLITSYEHLLHFLQQAGAFTSDEVGQLRSSAEAHPATAQLAMREAIILRELLFHIFSAIANQKRPSHHALQELNLFLNEAGCHRVVSREGGGFTWKWSDIGKDPKAALWPLAWRAAELLASDELALVRECASPSCCWLFLDKSKSHSRRWCDMKVCGNRFKVRRFYERARERSET
jgi:predicted RNA-binding Zn ribbon-like protein